MRKKKEQTVTLVVPKYNMRQEFGIQHAERLLDMGTAINGGWELPKDSNYTYDEENGPVSYTHLTLPTNLRV